MENPCCSPHMRFVRSSRGWIVSETRAAVADVLEAIALRQGFRVKGVCDELGVTEQHLRRLFQRDVGIAVRSWLHAERMVIARKRIRSGRCISDVAEELGFSHSNSFRRAFRETYGITATEYREQESRRSVSWSRPGSND